MSYLTQRDIEYLRPDLERAVERVLGNGHNDVRNTIEKCLHSGYDRKRTTEKLGSLIDNKKATRLYDKLEDILHEFKSSSKSASQRKRAYDDDDKSEKQYKKAKPTVRTDRNREGDDNGSPIKEVTAPPAPVRFVSAGPTVPTPAQAPASALAQTLAPVADTANLSSQQIEMMMAKARRDIETRQRSLSALNTKETVALPSSASIDPIAVPSFRVGQTPEDMERARKIAELQAQIKAKLSGMSAIIPPVQEKPKPLILDEQGRTVDNSGRAISIPTLAPTLKANIRAKKKETFNKVSQPSDRGFEEDGLKFMDDRITIKAAVRTKRALRFHEPGKFQQMAERMRMKTQLEKLQNEISQIARKTGISSATKLALIAPKQDSHADEVPQMEWWDSVILVNDLNTMDGDKIAIRESAVTNLIEHPTQMKPPSKLSIIYVLSFNTI